MAEISVDTRAVQQLQALQLRRARNIETTQQASVAAADRRADNERITAQEAETRRSVAAENAGRFDTEQRLRDRQLEAELLRIEEDRQDAARLLGEARQRGAIVDLLA